MEYQKVSKFKSNTLESLNIASHCVIDPVTLTVLDQERAVLAMRANVQERNPCMYAFCNMHTHNMARRKPRLAQALNSATVFNDGVGMDIASLILYGKKFSANLNGTDLTPALLSSFQRPVNVFLVGSTAEVVAAAADAVARTYPLVRIAGWHDGFFTDEQSDELVTKIREVNTELLLVGMGNPRQEIWAADIINECGAVIVCVGAFIDFAAGRFSRAPQWIRQMRCEWIYRMLLEPTRLWRRYIGGALPFLSAMVLARTRRH